MTTGHPIRANTGIKRMLQHYRRQFRIPENIDYYSEADFQSAERKFLKYALLQGRERIAAQYHQHGF